MRAATILTVDDSPDDLLLLKLACAAAKVSFELVSVESGEEAIAYLKSAPDDASTQHFAQPDLILLDLKMPGTSGFEVLDWVRAQPHLEKVPVIVLTSSVHIEDRDRALELGANQFLVKPVGYDGLQQLVRALDHLLLSKPAREPDKAQLGTNSTGPPITGADSVD